MISLLLSPSGRINRGKWWLGHLLLTFLMVLGVLIVVSPMLGQPDAKPGLGAAFIFGLISLLVLWSVICINIKRYHDLGKSGWWVLITFVPIIGPIWQFIECGFVSGEAEDNDYGPGPGMNIAEDIAALSKPGALASKDIDFNKYRSPQPPAPSAAAASGQATFGKRQLMPSPALVAG